MRVGKWKKREEYSPSLLFNFSILALSGATRSSPKGIAKSTPGSFLITPNTLATGLTAWLPPGGAVAQRLRGFESAEPEKTVKRSSRRTGVNLQFFPVQPSSLGLKGASSPFFVAPARRNRWHFSGSLLVSKENIPRLHPLLPSPVPHGTLYFSAAAVGMRTVYSM